MRDLIDPLPLAAMRRYYCDLIASGSLALGNGQVERRYALHSEPLARFFHGQLANLLSRIAGEAVKSSYVYLAAYQPGAVLEPHLDRTQCQVSISFLVDYAPEPDDVSPSSLFMQRKGVSSATALYQGIGDTAFYKGCEVVQLARGAPRKSLFHVALFPLCS